MSHISVLAGVRVGVDLNHRMKALLAEARACDVCAPYLAHGTRPVLAASADSRVLIIGQAPGKRVHQSGVPWDDASGNRLRDWLGVTRREFYDSARFAILPMGFCYPGKGSSGDLPPRPECAPLWHERILALMPQISVTLVIGRYAQERYLEDVAPNLTATVREWRRYWPDQIPLPHPSPRNRFWFAKNGWFETEVLPELRARVASLMIRE